MITVSGVAYEKLKKLADQAHRTIKAEAELAIEEHVIAVRKAKAAA